jgi:hypothetical protein
LGEDDLGEKTTKRLRLECTSASLLGLAKALGKRAVAKEAYFKALRAEIPELMKIETGKEERPRELDTFAAAFAVAGERQEMVADQETLALLKRFARAIPTLRSRGRNSSALKKAEQRFHKDFDGVDFTNR